jgi:GntR family transcriptional regulator
MLVQVPYHVNVTERKWQRIARLIRDNLPAPGENLPSEAELGEQYGVSRNTVRSALKALETEGHISSTAGALRVVRDTRRWRWNMTTWETVTANTAGVDAWATNIAEQGGTPSADVRVEIVPASDEVAQALEIEPGTTVIARVRTRYVDGEPHHLATSYVPQWIADDQPLLLQPGDQSVPGGLLAAAGHPQARLKDEIGTRMPLPDEARELNISAVTPLLIHSRTGYDKDGRPIRFMQSVMAGDSVIVSYEINIPTESA